MGAQVCARKEARGDAWRQGLCEARGLVGGLPAAVAGGVPGGWAYGRAHGAIPEKGALGVGAQVGEGVARVLKTGHWL